MRSAMPEILRKTLTWDQGREMANHTVIAAATERDVYFCGPHSPWQRRTNENTNGLLHRYFAMGTNCRCSRRATSTTSRSN
jgi:transposase, IS30 family